MFIAILTLLSALSISGVAIFYSVIGLATIFPGAFIPVIIMGGVLEIGKLITASWLYRNWKFTPFMLRTYLTTAVIILSFITSMGIFGFLSKAHLEQNLASDTLVQRIQIINDKIDSEKNSIVRQNAVIDRLEKSINRSTGTADGDIEVQQSIIADANEKLKTLLTVETNTVKDLNDRLKVLDKNVSDILTSNKSFFNEEKAAADLKASQKAEREQIAVNVKEAQKRIAELKADHKAETAEAKTVIANMRAGSQDNKSTFTQDIETAENKIFDSQGKIDVLIVEKQPLEKKMLTLEAEIGPVKYIAALAVDWGITDQVETSKAVRWVILLLIVVFDPLAVLLLIAANQSLMRRFPPEPPKPEEVLDLEKPDDDELTLKWNEMMGKANAEANAAVKIDKATAQLKDWKEKLETFNSKVPKPEAEVPVEIVQEDTSVPHVDLKGGPRPTVTDGFDPDEHAYDMVSEPKVDKDKQLEEFKKREEEERQALEEYARKAAEDEPTISEQIEEAMEPERIKPDFTEVLEPEVAVEPKQEMVGMIGQRTVNQKSGKVVEPPKPQVPEQTTPAEMTDEERTGMLDKFHNLHGKYQDISDEELKVERDQSNKAQFLADVSLTKEQAAQQGPVTESRMAFFEDMIDDILRGDTTFENVPEENRKIIAQIMDPEIENPSIITKGSALKDQHPDGLEEMSAEGLKEKFMISPQTEDRPMTDDELDNLLQGFEEDKPKGKTRLVIKDGKKMFVPIEGEYVQNEEQTDETKWEPVKELDLPEPEKNEIILPDLPNTEEVIPDIAESISIEQSISPDKFTNYKKRLTSEEDYHQRVEARITDLITKLENGEVKLNDLTQEDQQVIMDILNQNG